MIYSSRKRAMTAVLIMVLLPVLLGFAVLTIDIGAMYNAKGDLQRAADAASLAGAAELESSDEFDAVDMVQQIVAANPIFGCPSVSNEIVFGRADYNMDTGAYDFIPDSDEANAIRVTVQCQLSLYFAGIFGKSSSNISADAVAIYVSTCYQEGDCYDNPAAGKAIMCHSDSDSGDSDSDSGDSDSGDSASGDSDSGDSASGDSDSGDSDSGNSDSSDSGDSESSDFGDSERTIIVDSNAVPIFLSSGDVLGACDYCPFGDSDDSDDSQGEFGPPDSSDSDDSDAGDSDSDDSDAGDSDSGDSDAGDSDSGDIDGGDSGDSDSGDSDSDGEHVTICHIPPGNPSDAHLITVGENAILAHLAHGDVLGYCPFEIEVDNGCAPSTIHVFLIE